jgi:hypothetical protein
MSNLTSKTRSKKNFSADGNGHADEEENKIGLDAYYDDDDGHGDDRDDDPDTGLPYEDDASVDDGEPYHEPERVAEFVKRFHAGWKKTSEGYMEAAHALLDAKRELKHKDFGKMVVSELELKPKSAMRTAQMLMEIARNPVLNAKKFSHLLSRSWTSTHKLTKLPDETLEELFENNNIRSDILGSEAQALVDTHKEGKSRRDHVLARFTEAAEKAAEVFPDPTVVAQTNAKLAAWFKKLAAACLPDDEPVRDTRHKADKKRNSHAAEQAVEASP